MSTPSKPYLTMNATHDVANFSRAAPVSATSENGPDCVQPPRSPGPCVPTTGRAPPTSSTPNTSQPRITSSFPGKPGVSGPPGGGTGVPPVLGIWTGGTPVPPVLNLLQARAFTQRVPTL